MDAFDAALRRRRPSRTIVGFAAMGLCGLLLLAATAAIGGPVPFLLSVTLAVLPVPLLLVVVLGMDQLEPEPTRNLVLAFVWGATGAAILAGTVNTIGISITSVFLGPGGGTSAYVTLGAPVVEETLKAAVLVGFLLFRNQELDGPTDGIVYAGMVGLGFAFSENLAYYAAAYLMEGASGLAFTFALRGILSPFLHPLFTSMTGMALGYVALRRRGAARALLPLLGLAGAILLHALWNGTATIGGLLPLALIYLLVMLPVLATVVMVTRSDRRRVARLIRQLLPRVAPPDLVTAQDLEMLASLDGRRSSVHEARRDRGPAAAEALRTYQRAATELALAHHRLDRGVVDRSWVTSRERALLPLMGAARRVYERSRG